jgi:trehalose 6-phosphate synthase/phosphatase
VAAERLNSIRRDIGAVLGDAPVQVIEGRMVLELRPRGASKGMVVPRIVEKGPRGPLVAIGDDRTDEEMFAALPRDGVAIRVGDGPTCASYRLADHHDARRLLEALLDRT